MAKGKMELEELYLGVPDDYVSLTFQHLAQLNINSRSLTSPAISEQSTRPTMTTAMAKLPSLDFSKGLQETSSALEHKIIYRRDDHDHHRVHQGGYRRDVDTMNSQLSGTTSISMSMSMADNIGAGRRRRPGIPHSNICAVCCDYIYIFRHRCLVCGRAYCRQCVTIGMGDMAEGRKCIDCLGRRFSQRCIKKAGKTGWCCMGYPSGLKQMELKWAEKGPRRSGENKYYSNNHAVMSRTRSPIVPPSHSNPPSFVMNSSPYNSPRNQHNPMPF
ncbi:extra-large guanine nucleotide-binding protein 3-like [Andrographis paniculata]|uniref:extra-large guanine nucleotide-binding protein 3-like n=1 Tax=Andrographis paniculata TaxID=175694 RepID=UPI0021E829D8|nr:extra-large guanine nucleotide-binding protein 3-like [Andrographis paniculata]